MQPYRFAVGVSWYLTALYLFMHLGAIIILLLLAMPWWVKLILIGYCFYSFSMIIYREVFRLGPKAVTGFWKKADAGWMLQEKTGETYLVQLQGSSVCTSYFACLNFKDKERKRNYSIVIMPDTLSPDDFRKLRVSLRF